MFGSGAHLGPALDPALISPQQQQQQQQRQQRQHVLLSPAASVHDQQLLLSPPLLASPTTLRPTDSAVPVEPGFVHPHQHTVTTPLTPSDADPFMFPPNIMNLVVGGALAPSSSAAPNLAPQQPAKQFVPLRLPSFEMLGIASPHPDRVGAARRLLDSPGGGGGMASAVVDTALNPEPSKPFHAMHLPPPTSPRARHSLDRRLCTGAGRAVATPIRHDVATLTPPADASENIAWNSVSVVSHAAMDSPATDQAGATSPDPNEESSPARLSGSGQSVSPPIVPSWIAGALETILASLQTAALPANSLRVLSHALPSPSPNGHVFSSIVDAIHSSTPAQPTVWINVFHAIQGRFNLADLPTSPPSTPGPAVGGDDYFTQKVFDTAVPILDYQQDLSSLPRSPRPIVPPSSINVSIVERYLPPSSTCEIDTMFNPSGPSILVDRMVELSPNNGTLVFVYPTHAGGETFMKEYLGPLLDPELRRVVVLHGLSSNLSASLGRMAAADQLPDFGRMRHSMRALCEQLTQRSSSMDRFYGRRAAYALVHASREEVFIDRETWSSEWWVKQEKQRIREVMTRYAQDAQRMSSNEHIERAPTPTELVSQLLDGVTKRSYERGREPKSGIEVSVFVIKRSG